LPLAKAESAAWNAEDEPILPEKTGTDEFAMFQSLYYRIIFSANRFAADTVIDLAAGTAAGGGVCCSTKYGPGGEPKMIRYSSSYSDSII
jgi:hypothetical protein